MRNLMFGVVLTARLFYAGWLTCCMGAHLVVSPPGDPKLRNRCACSLLSRSVEGPTLNSLPVWSAEVPA